MRILDFSNPAAAELQTSGGKGSSLAKLTLGGFAVPRGFIITSSAYREFLAQSTQRAHFDVDNLALLEEQSKAYRAHLMSLELGGELLLELEKALGGFDDTQSFSVRSSSTLEDLSAGAFAGAHDTFLHCYKDEIATKIKACFASLWHTRAIAYRAKMGFAHDEAFMAVVVQEMIQADKSGVGFSINPIDCNFSQVLLNANYGLGESVVGGEFDVDEYRVSKDDFSLTHSFIANKTHAIFARDTQSPYIEPHWRSESGSAKNPLQSPESLSTSDTPHADGTQRFGIKPSFATAPALTPEEIAEVAQLMSSSKHSMASRRILSGHLKTKASMCCNHALLRAFHHDGHAMRARSDTPKPSRPLLGTMWSEPFMYLWSILLGCSPSRPCRGSGLRCLTTTSMVIKTP